MQEEWRDVVGFEGLYSVSNYGFVKSHITNKILTPRISTKYGKPTYRGVALYKYLGFKNYLRKDLKIAAVVAEAFIGERPKGFLIDHIDCNKRNDRADNLEYVSCLENVRRAVANGLLNGRNKRSTNIGGVPFAIQSL